MCQRSLISYSPLSQRHFHILTVHASVGYLLNVFLRVMNLSENTAIEYPEKGTGAGNPEKRYWARYRRDHKYILN